MEATIRSTAGRLRCREVRHTLKACASLGLKIRWTESAGWLEREFTITGDRVVLRMIHRAMAKGLRAMSGPF